MKTMLRLAKEQDVIKVVADQHGGPTWVGDIAATWYGFAEAIFEQAEGLGMMEKQPRIEPITTDEYPTPAQRPLNSVLDCHKIAQQLNIRQPDWRTGLSDVLGSWKAR